MSVGKVRVAAIVGVVALGTSAAAQPTTPRDEGTATLWSVGGTVAPLLTAGATVYLIAADGELSTPALALGVMSIAGFYALPSAGHWYSGKRWTAGFAIRTVGLGLAAIGGIRVIQNQDCHCFCDRGNGNYWLAGIGAGLMLGGAIYDIETAGSRARAFNARLAPTVTPVPMPGGGGVSLAMTF